MELRARSHVIPEMREKSRSVDMNGPGITVIYDGDCPFCASYVSMMRLREAVGEVVLVNAREGDARVRAVQKAGYDLDTGMVVLWRDEVFFGDGAVHLLATLSSGKDGLFDRIQRAAFANPRRAARLYPVLAAGRRLFLRLVGRKPIGSLAEKNSAGRE
jgi:predicted DCC family thiol-disulfide oxidoreductase YuxK